VLIRRINKEKETTQVDRVLMVLSTVDIGGGVQSKVMDLYRQVDRSRIQFDFFVHANLTTESYEKEINSMGGEVYFFGRVKDIGIYNYIKNIYQLTKKEKYKAVHSYVGLNDGLILLISRMAKIKIRISHVRTNVTKAKKRKSLKPIFKFLISRNATKLLASSKQAGESLYGKKSFEVIPNALDIDRFINVEKVKIEALRKTAKINDNMIVLGHVGRFSYEKNHDYLLEIAIKLREQSLDFKMILVGDGELKKDFKNELKENNLEQYFYVAGVQSNVEVFYHIFDVLLFPSFHEGFGNVAVEAQVAKNYVIASDGVSPEVDLGLELVDFVDLDSIETWLEKIINHHSRDSINVTDQQIKKKLKNRYFDLEHSIEKYYKIYDV